MENRSNHFNGNVSQQAIIEKDGKFLVCRGIGDSVWGFPGGRLHKDEEPEKGLIREIKEELGIIVKIVRPIHICRSYHVKSKVWQVLIGYQSDILDDTNQKIDPTEIEEVKWISKEDLKNLSMFNECREIADIYLNSGF